MRIPHTLLLFAFSALFGTSLNAAPWPEPKSDFGGAEPLNLSSWYTFEDYPQSALAGNEQGMVVIGFTIGVNGRMTDCHVVQSSKHKDLDAVPCRVLTRRARFKPATDAQGQPRSTVGTTAMSFWTP
jgi:TonB family protein